MITTEVSWERLVQRAFEKIRQASRGMPAVMIRQLDALAKIMERTTTPADRQVLLDEATMIERLSAGTVDEPTDRADTGRAYQRVVAAGQGILAAPAPVTRRGA